MKVKSTRNFLYMVLYLLFLNIYGWQTIGWYYSPGAVFLVLADVLLFMKGCVLKQMRWNGLQNPIVTNVNLKYDTFVNHVLKNIYYICIHQRTAAL